MPAINNRFQMTYGAFTIGGASTTHLLVRSYRTDRSYDRFSVEAEVLVVASSAATLISRCNELEAAFRLPRQRLTVTLDGATFEDFNPAVMVNSGFDADATCDKAGERSDTDRSRLYRVSVAVSLPSDLAGQGGRTLDATVTVEESPAQQRTVTFRGSYTAIAGTNAWDTYEAAATTYRDAWLAAKFPAVGPTPAPQWDHIGPRNVTQSDSDKSISYELQSLEVLEGKTASTAPGFNDPTIRNHSVTVIRAWDGGEEASINGQRAVPGQVYRALYSAFVSREEAQDLTDRWDSDVVPWLYAEAARITQTADLTVIVAEARFDPTTSHFEGELRFWTPVSNLLGAQVTVRLKITGGYRFMPMADGDPDTFSVFDGKRVIIKSYLIARVFIGQPRNARVVGPGAVDDPGFLGALVPAGGTWYPIDMDVPGSPTSIGTAQYGSQELYRLEETWVYRFVKARSAVQATRDLSTIAREADAGGGAEDGAPRGGKPQAVNLAVAGVAGQVGYGQSGKPTGGKKYSGSPSGLNANITIPGSMGAWGIQ